MRRDRIIAGAAVMTAMTVMLSLAACGNSNESTAASVTADESSGGTEGTTLSSGENILYDGRNADGGDAEVTAEYDELKRFLDDRGIASTIYITDRWDEENSTAYKVIDIRAFDRNDAEVIRQFMVEGNLRTDIVNIFEPVSVDVVVMETDGSSMLVKAVEGAWEASYDCISVPCSEIRDGSVPVEGMVYTVEYTGIILETYPSMFDGISDMYISPSVPDPDGQLCELITEFTPIEIKPQCAPAYGVTFALPEGWEYEVVDSDDEPTSETAVYIRPADEPDDGGSIVLQCFSYPLLVCGTELVQINTDFNGHKAYKGYYNGNESWSYITLQDEYEGCTVLNQISLYEKYRDTVDAMLATVEFIYCDISETE